MEYTRDLGYCAAKYLISGGSGVMVTIQAGQFVPVPFDTMLDPETGRTKVRLVDVDSTRYSIARRYMIRLRRDDFERPEALAIVRGDRGDLGSRVRRGIRADRRRRTTAAHHLSDAPGQASFARYSVMPKRWRP